MKKCRYPALLCWGNVPQIDFDIAPLQWFVTLTGAVCRWMLRAHIQGNFKLSSLGKSMLLNANQNRQWWWKQMAEWEYMVVIHPVRPINEDTQSGRQMLDLLMSSFNCVPGRRKEAADTEDKRPSWIFWQDTCLCAVQLCRPASGTRLLKPALARFGPRTRNPACCIPVSCHFSSQNDISFLSYLCFPSPRCLFPILVCLMLAVISINDFFSPPAPRYGNEDGPKPVQAHKRVGSGQHSMKCGFSKPLHHPRESQLCCNGAHSCYMQIYPNRSHRDSVPVSPQCPQWCSPYLVDGGSSREWHRLEIEEC